MKLFVCIVCLWVGLVSCYPSSLPPLVISTTNNPASSSSVSSIDILGSSPVSSTTDAIPAVSSTPLTTGGDTIIQQPNTHLVHPGGPKPDTSEENDNTKPRPVILPARLPPAYHETLPNGQSAVQPVGVATLPARLPPAYQETLPNGQSAVQPVAVATLPARLPPAYQETLPNGQSAVQPVGVATLPARLPPAYQETLPNGQSAVQPAESDVSGVQTLPASIPSAQQRPVGAPIPIALSPQQKETKVADFPDSSEASDDIKPRPVILPARLPPAYQETLPNEQSVVKPAESDISGVRTLPASISSAQQKPVGAPIPIALSPEQKEAHVTGSNKLQSSVHSGGPKPDSSEDNDDTKPQTVILPARLPPAYKDTLPNGQSAVQATGAAATLPARLPPSYQETLPNGQSAVQPAESDVSGVRTLPAPIPISQQRPAGAPIPIALSPKQTEERVAASATPPETLPQSGSGTKIANPFLQNPRVPVSLLDSLKGDDFKYFVNLVTSNELQDFFKVSGPVTLFLPNEESMSKLDDSIKSNQTALRRFFKSLVVTWPYKYDTLETRDQVYALEGNPIYPRKVTQDGKDVLYVNGARVTEKRDIPAPYGGYVQVIDSLMLPIPDGNIADVILQHPDWSTFAGYMRTTNILNNPLKRNEGYTVLIAPDSAITSVAEDKTQDDTQKLTELLKRHIIPNALYRATLTSGNVKALNDELLSFQVDKDNKVTINGVAVTQFDIPATNGVIYLVDKIIPASPDEVRR